MRALPNSDGAQVAGRDVCFNEELFVAGHDFHQARASFDASAHASHSEIADSNKACAIALEFEEAMSPQFVLGADVADLQLIVIGVRS